MVKLQINHIKLPNIVMKNRILAQIFQMGLAKLHNNDVQRSGVSKSADLQVKDPSWTVTFLGETSANQERTQQTSLLFYTKCPLTIFMMM